jgi:hypothetical protein
MPLVARDAALPGATQGRCSHACAARGRAEVFQAKDVGVRGEWPRDAAPTSVGYDARGAPARMCDTRVR